MPKGVKEIECFLVGGGGNGGLGIRDGPIDANSVGVSGGGGGGGYTKIEKLKVNQGEMINIAIASVASNTICGEIIANTGNNGGSANKIGDLKYSGSSNGGSGGSGGGGGGIAHIRVYSGANGGVGGSDGKDGGNGTFTYTGGRSWALVGNSGGAGQGTTTRAFGEADGTLYASGGNGGSTWYQSSMYWVFGGGGSNGNPETNGQGIAIIRWGY